MVETISPKQAACQLDITDRQVRRLCRVGKLRGAVKTGGRWRIPGDANPKLKTDGNKATPRLSEKMFDLIEAYNHSILQKCTLKREAFDLWADEDEIVNPFSIFTDDNDEFLQSRMIAILIDEIKRLKASKQ